MDKVRGRVRVDSSKVEGLASNTIGRPAIGKGSRVANAEIGARAALYPIITGEFVALEQVAGIEDKALCVFIRDAEAGRMRGIRAYKQLPHRLDDMRRVLRREQDGPAGLKPCGCHRTVVGRLDVGAVAVESGNVADGSLRATSIVDADCIAPRVKQRREHQSTGRHER